MFNVMTPDHHAAILAKFGLHGPRKQMGGLGAFGGGTSPTDPHGGTGGMPADPHGGTGTPPATGGGTPTYQPMPNPGMPHVTPPSLGALLAAHQQGGQPPSDPRTGVPTTGGQFNAYGPAGQGAGLFGGGGQPAGQPAGQPPADPRTGMPAAAGQYATTGPAGGGQALLTPGQAPATGQLPPWLQNLLALMR